MTVSIPLKVDVPNLSSSVTDSSEGRLEVHGGQSHRSLSS